MKIHLGATTICVFMFNLLLSGCGPGQLLGSTVTPQPTTTDTPTFTPSPTATQTQTQTPTPTITPSPTQVGGGAGKIVFELNKDEFIKYFPNLEGELNVFTANLDSTGLIPITNGLMGYNYIESVSPDGTKLLIASGSNQYFKNDKELNLYLIDLNSLESEPINLANGLPENAWRGAAAKWINDTRLVYIGKGGAGFGIYLVKSDGTNRSNIYKYNNDGVTHKPADILAVSGTQVYWDSAITTSLGGNRSSTDNLAWWSSMDGSQQGTLDFHGTQIKFSIYFNPLVFTNDGTELVWVEPATSTFHHNYLHIASVLDLDKAYQLDILSSFPTLRWLPDNLSVLVYDQQSIRMQEVRGIDTTSNLFGLYEVSNSSSMTVRNKNNSKVLDILVPPDSRGYGIYCLAVLGDLSPDGHHILVYVPNNECESKLNLLDLETMTFSELLPNFVPRDVHWLP